MSTAVENDDLVLELDAGESAGIALFAGGTTGLVLLDSTGGREAFWTSLGERAEGEGLSALGFAGSVPGDPADAGDHAVVRHAGQKHCGASQPVRDRQTRNRDAQLRRGHSEQYLVRIRSCHLNRLHSARHGVARG